MSRLPAPVRDEAAAPRDLVDLVDEDDAALGRVDGVAAL